MELTEEDIKKMSPEQLRQLQKQNCIFCSIVAKNVQSRVIYEDDLTLAVLDINPANPGHILLLPKEHYSVMPQMPDELVAHMGMIAKQLSVVMVRAFAADGTSIVAANGVAAGQRASHFMMHIIPRKEGDNVGIMLAPGKIGEAELVGMQKLLAPLIARAFGKEVVEPVEEEPPKEEKAMEKVPEKKAAEPEKKKEEPKKKPQPPQEQREELPPEHDDGPVEDDNSQGRPNLDDITSFLLGGK